MGSDDNFTRMFIGWILISIIASAAAFAEEYGYGIAESIVIGVIAPPVVVTVAAAAAWAVGTVAVHANKYIKIRDRL